MCLRELYHYGYHVRKSRLGALNRLLSSNEIGPWMVMSAGAISSLYLATPS